MSEVVEEVLAVMLEGLAGVTGMKVVSLPLVLVLVGVVVYRRQSWQSFGTSSSIAPTEYKQAYRRGLSFYRQR